MRTSDLDDMIVGDVIAHWPATVEVFNARRMACPGCVMAPFMTVAESADAYDLDIGELARDLAERIDDREPA